MNNTAATTTTASKNAKEMFRTLWRLRRCGKSLRYNHPDKRFSNAANFCYWARSGHIPRSLQHLVNASPMIP